MRFELELGLVTLCHSEASALFWLQHVVANMFMPEKPALRYPLSEKSGLAVTHGDNDTQKEDPVVQTISGPAGLDLNPKPVSPRRVSRRAA
ncbi:MAG: hypothetical protein ACRD7E_09815, partial [Bryobacteraceae bacterium]